MIYDYTTKNISFLKMYKILKDMGVKNNKFFLTLYDNKLQGIDPYDKNLSLEIKARIVKEVRINPWYYLREVIRIPVPGGHTTYMLHKGNLAQTFCMLLFLDIFLTLPRQFGKTIGAVSIYSWQYNFATKNSNMIFSNKELADSQLNIKRLNDIVELLPDYLKTHLNHKTDTNNINLLRCEATNNSIRALSTARDIAGADKLGRGLTIPTVWFDEFAFLKFNDTIYASAAPALSKASEEAKKRGTPNGKLITTTPNNLDCKEGLYCYQMIENSAKFDESWYDWEPEKIKEFVFNNSKNNFVYIEYSFKDLGRDDKWYQEQVRSLNGDMIKVKRELLLQWTYANNTSPFSEEQLMQIEMYAKKPIGKFFIDNIYRFDINAEMTNMYAKSWIVSVDVATGMGSDSSAITIIDPADMKAVCEFSSNTISTTDLSILLVKLVTNFVPNAVVVVERNNGGFAVIDLLLKSKISKNLYYENRIKKAEKKILDPKVKASKTKTETRVYGIDTTSKSREIMVNEILFMIVNERPDCIVSEKIFNEIRTLTRNKKNKIEHQDGFHDDSLMSYLIGLYTLLYGTNTNKFIKNISSITSENQITQNQIISERINNLYDTIDRYKVNNNMSNQIIEKYLNSKPTSSLDSDKQKTLKMMNFIISSSK